MKLSVLIKVHEALSLAKRESSTTARTFLAVSHALSMLDTEIQAEPEVKVEAAAPISGETMWRDAVAAVRK